MANAVAIVRIVTEIVSLFPTLIPAVQSAIQGIKDSFDKNKVITSADITNVVNRAAANHAIAVAQLDPVDPVS